MGGLCNTATMTTVFKKNRKKRGHVSAGHGRVGKHRKSPGGRGDAGGQHHHKIYFEKFCPEYFGKVGMRYYKRTTQKFSAPIVNVERLWSLLGDNPLSCLPGVKDSVPVIDVSNYGFVKVLGKGCLPKQRLVVK